MDLFMIMMAITPIVIFYWLLSWEEAYYKRHASYLRYRTFKARLPVYLTMVSMAVGAILVALPFIVLVLTK